MSAPSPDDKVLYSADEAARLLNSTRRTLERWRSEGNGPRFVKVGHKVCYRRAALDAWIMQRERANTTESRRLRPTLDDQPSEDAA